MKVYKTLIVIGVLVIIVPQLGLPSAHKSVIGFILGVSTIILAVLVKLNSQQLVDADHKKRGSIY